MSLGWRRSSAGFTRLVQRSVTLEMKRNFPVATTPRTQRPEKSIYGVI